MEYYGQIYAITNLINNKMYIGMTKGKDVLKDRYGGDLEKNTHNQHLKYSIARYGIDNFKIETLCYSETYEKMKNDEIYYIKLYNTTDPNYGYNVDPGGCGGQQSDIGRQKLSIASRNYWDSHPEMKEVWSKRYSGNNNPMHIHGHSDESKEKMRIVRKRMINEGVINMQEIQKLSMTKEAKRKRVLSSAKYIYKIYDLNYVLIACENTLKDLYEYLITNNYEVHYKSYKSFKLKLSQEKIFNNQIYKEQGIYIEKLDKKQVDTEVTN